MYKVKNISSDPRKFKEKGIDIIIMPGKEVITSSPPANSDVFEVKEIKSKKEVNE